MDQESYTFKKCPPEKPYYRLEVQPGKTYMWCSCGKCRNQPFWDGAEAAPHCTPVAYTATKVMDVDFCGCRITQNPPYCDSTHKQLK